MKRIKYYILILVLSCSVLSCDVDFNPNEEWTDIPVIYGFLDQGADTNFIRIEKCFLGEGDMLTYAKIKDSIFYNPADLSVKVLAVSPRDENQVLEEIECFYQNRGGRPDGLFFSGESPVFFFPSKGVLKGNRIYKVVVENLKTGNVATASTKLVGDYGIINPGREILKFDRGLRTDRELHLDWSFPSYAGQDVTKGKLFQPMIRFYYLEDHDGDGVCTDLVYVDILFSVFKRSTAGDQQYKLKENVFVKGVIQEMNKRPYRKQFLDDGLKAELYLYACDNNMAIYLNLNKPEKGQLQARPLFSNIHNGIGLFAARRLHVKKQFTIIDTKLTGAIGNADGFARS